MLLAVDIGNTNTKFGAFDGDHLVAKLSVPTIRNVSAGSLSNILRERIDKTYDAAIVCSVVPEANAAVAKAIFASFGVQARVVQNNDDFGLDVNHEPLEDAGTDRLVNAFAAAEMYGSPCIVCSFGTATTIDVVDKDRALIGGLIAPGIRSMSTAMKLTTSRLPEVEIAITDGILQNTTVECLRSGIVNGYISMAHGLIERIKREMGDDPKVVATGGYATLVAENSKLIDSVDVELLLNGLQQLHARSQTE